MSSALQGEFSVGGDGEISPAVAELLKGSWIIYIFQACSGFRWFRWLMALGGLLIPLFCPCRSLQLEWPVWDWLNHKQWDFSSSKFFFHSLFSIKGDEGLWEQDTSSASLWNGPCSKANAKTLNELLSFLHNKWRGKAWFSELHAEFCWLKDNLAHPRLPRQECICLRRKMLTKMDLNTQTKANLNLFGFFAFLKDNLGGDMSRTEPQPAAALGQNTSIPTAVHRCRMDSWIHGIVGS